MKKTKLTRTLMAACSVVALSAVMYGCVHSGDGDEPPKVEAPDLSAQIAAAKKASDAAMTASNAAAAAVIGVEGIRDYDAVSYVDARTAAAAAAAASSAAKEASAAAAAAETVADADKAQAAAEAAQANAEAAQANAEKYAGMVTAAKTKADQAAKDAADAAAAEAKALTEARSAADVAADLAEADATAAAKELGNVMDDADADQASYDMAAAAAADAMKAATAARNASDAAGRAATSADAKAQQAIAEEKQGEAATALADAKKYAGMVADAKKQDVADAAEAKALKDAQDAAGAAEKAAKKASDDASAAVMAVAGSKDLNVTTAAAYARAEDAAADAALALGNAIAANAKAQAATTSEEAKEHQADAEAAQTAAEIAYTSAKGFADVVEQQQQMADDAADEAEKLETAQKAASGAATKARKAATDARAAADAAKVLVGSEAQSYMDADEAATAAEAAATAAEAASKKAASATTSEEAEEAQMAAMEEEENAQTQLGLAVTAQGRAQDVANATDRALIVGYQEDAKAAMDEADRQAKAARSNATMARMEATNARASANLAMAARTDYATADAKATAAETAATAAETAATAAEKAASDAAEDYEAATVEDVSAEAAKTARDDAEMEEDVATTQAGTASTSYDTAKSGAADAATAADTHVLSLFTAANAYDVTGTTAKALEVASVGTAMATTAAAANGNQGGGTTASAAWPGVADDPDTTADESAGNILTITVNPGQTENLVSDTVGSATVGPNAKKVDGIGSFKHGFDMMRAATDEQPGSRILAFTDREQAVAAVAAVAGKSLTNQGSLTAGNIKSLSSAGGTSFTGTYDDDGDDTTPVLTGTFKCPDTQSCTMDYSYTDGVLTVADASNYQFTGSRPSTPGTAANPNTDYLIFGLWLNETTAGGDTFGSFAAGGDAFETGTINGITGKATYKGSAAGAHHKTGSAVSFFDGDATLNADFGTADAAGTIKGSIDNIRVNGGAALTQSIHLVSTTVTNGSVTFNGAAVMGMQASPGSASHQLNGNWSGGYYNDPAAGSTGAATQPGAVAGTFGVTGTVVDNAGTANDIIETFVGAFGAKKQ